MFENLANATPGGALVAAGLITLAISFLVAYATKNATIVVLVTGLGCGVLAMIGWGNLLVTALCGGFTFGVWAILDAFKPSNLSTRSNATGF